MVISDQRRPLLLELLSSRSIIPHIDQKITGTRLRGRPKMRWLDRLKGDMRIHFCQGPEMATDRKRWAVMVKTSTPPRWYSRRRKWLVTVSNLTSNIYSAICIKMSISNYYLETFIMLNGCLSKSHYNFYFHWFHFFTLLRFRCHLHFAVRHLVLIQ